MATKKTQKAKPVADSPKASHSSPGARKPKLSIEEREWRLLQRLAKNPESKLGKEIATTVGAFVATNVAATQTAEALSTMLHSGDHGMSSIQQYLTEQPLTAFALLRLIRIERARGASQLELEAHKKMSSKGGVQRDVQAGYAKKRKQIQEIWASGKYKSKSLCAEQECAGLNMAYDTARKALIEPRKKS